MSGSGTGRVGRSSAEDGRTRRARRQREARRRQILEAAQAVFATRGYQESSVEHVIAAAGIARGTFYLYFESRSQLLLDLLDGFIARLTEALTVVEPTSDQPSRGVFDNIRRVVRLLFAEPYLSIVLLREAVGLGTHVEARLRAFDDHAHEMMSGALRNGAAHGLTRPVDFDVVAAMVVGGIKEVLCRSLSQRPERQPDPDAVAEEIFDFCLRGLIRR